MSNTPAQPTKFSAGDQVRIVKECPWGNVGDTGRIRHGTKPEPGMVNEDDFEWPTIDLLDGTFAYHVPESVLVLVEPAGPALTRVW